MSKFELDTTGADVSIEVSGGSVHLGVFNQDIDGGDYADAYLTPTEARQIAAALTAAADAIDPGSQPPGGGSMSDDGGAAPSRANTEAEAARKDLYAPASVFVVQVREAREKARVLHEERLKACDEMRQAIAHHDFLVRAADQAGREIGNAQHALEVAVKREAHAMVTEG